MWRAVSSRCWSLRQYSILSENLKSFKEDIRRFIKYFDGAFQVYGNYVDPRKLPKSRLIFLGNKGRSQQNNFVYRTTIAKPCYIFIKPLSKMLNKFCVNVEVWLWSYLLNNSHFLFK